MGNDLFGGLMKGLSSVLPQDDPDVKKFTSQAELKELKDKEQQIFAEIGKKALEEDPAKYTDHAERLKALRVQIAEVEGVANEASAQAAAKAEAEQAAKDARTCPECGFVNEEGVKFCQECGTKLGEKLFCPNCGAELEHGTKFCGECGTKIGE